MSQQSNKKNYVVYIDFSFQKINLKDLLIAIKL